MKDVDADAVFNDMAAKNRLYAGRNTIVDHRDDAVHEAMVWATGGVWYTHHFHPGHPKHRDRKTAAMRDAATLHIPRGPGPVKTL